MANNISLFPVSGWQIGPVPLHDIIALKLHFLSHPLQKNEEAQESQMFAMTPAQGRELIDRIQAAIEVLENSDAQGSGLERH
ncbi:bssS family protein [Vreelandella populi]|nr:bssS family protein [Halomonas populi]